VYTGLIVKGTTIFLIKTGLLKGNDAARGVFVFPLFEDVWRQPLEPDHPPSSTHFYALDLPNRKGSIVWYIFTYIHVVDAYGKCRYSKIYIPYMDGMGIERSCTRKD